MPLTVGGGIRTIEDIRALLNAGSDKVSINSAAVKNPEFVREAGLPDDAEGQRAALAEWHARKTAIYTGMVADGALPARPGVSRVIGTTWPASRRWHGRMRGRRCATRTCATRARPRRPEVAREPRRTRDGH